MARIVNRLSRAAELGLDTVTIEGGLIAPEQVQKIVGAPATAKLAASYDCPRGTSLNDEVARYFRIGQALWSDYDRIAHKTLAHTVQFAHDLLTQCFGFDDLTGPVEHVDGNRRYRLAREAKQGRVPIVVAAPAEGREAFNFSALEFGDGAGGGRLKRSPVSLLQDWLNANPTFYWGLIFAGDKVRLMRDNASLTRPAWIEADLGAIFAGEMIVDFTAWWLLTHATRFGAAGAPPSDCPLEEWRAEGLKQGETARADLYKNVREALSELGQGAVEANPALREKLGDHATLSAFFEELLRTAYRLIFLAVAEDRDLLHPGRVPQEARGLYRDSYSFGFWRERARRRVARDTHHDAWEAMKITLRSLEHGQELLGLPALGGLFAAGATPLMNGARISNRRFLTALHCLGFIMRGGATHRINWRDLKTEELGSVYEGLLEITPQLTAADVFTLDDNARGNARKTSGSYYTPDSLVETLLDSALDPVLQKAEDEAATPEAKVAAILDLKVIDPACGSGHFLLGAARRMADRVARLRNEDAGKAETQAALRDVVSRCIHGVDRNPMAVELAKVALWIESVSPGKPLGFLDGNIRCGDALLGVFDLDALELGIPDEAYKPLTGDSRETAGGLKKLNKAERDRGLLKLAFDRGKLSSGFRRFHQMSEATPREVAARAQEYERLRLSADWEALRQACDIYVAAFLLPKPKLDDLFARPLVPTTGDLSKAVHGGSALGTGAVQGKLAAAVNQAAWSAQAFHWPLEFPDVLLGQGGFDVVLGNPPWEVLQLGEQEYFESRVPDIADMKGAARKKAIAGLVETHPEIFAEYAQDKRRFEAVNDFARAGGRFDLTARGKVNTYALFAEHFLNLTRNGGRAGVIVPTGIATDATTAPFFGHLVSEQRLAALTDFENSAPLFPGVHRSFKFSLLTIGSSVAAADFAFFLTDPAQLEDPRRRFTLSPQEIARINPNTKTAPVFRSRYDAELTASIYNRVSVLIEEGREGGNPWRLEFRQGLFNMTSDSGMFRTAAQLEAEGFYRKGMDWVRDSGGSYVPLYEAKMIHHFDHRWATYDDVSSRNATLTEKQNVAFELTARYWVHQREVAARLDAKGWRRDWLMGWRDICRATDERTLIADASPRTACGDTLLLMFTNVEELRLHSALLGNLCSLSGDYACRQKIGGTHLKYNIFNQLPILPPSAYSEADLAFIVPRVLELTYTSHSMAPFARDLGYEGAPFAWDEDRRAQLRAELDAWYALAYGLIRDELRYVLDPADVMGPDYPSETFRVLKSNEERKFGEYRTRRLVLAAYDTLTAQGLRPRLEGYR